MSEAQLSPWEQMKAWWMDLWNDPTNDVALPEGGYVGLEQYITQQMLGSQGTDPYMQLGSPNDVTNINPYSSNLWSSIFGPGTGGSYNLPGGEGYVPGEREGSLFNQAMSAAFSGAGSQSRMYEDAMQSLISGNRGNPLAAQAFGAADLGMRDAVRATSQAYGTQNALYSGGFTDTATRAAMEARQNAILPYMQTYGQLGQQAQQSGQSLVASLLGQAGALSGQQYYTPSYVANPNYINPMEFYGLQQGIDTKNNAIMAGGLGTAITGIATALGGK